MYKKPAIGPNFKFLLIAIGLLASSCTNLESVEPQSASESIWPKLEIPTDQMRGIDISIRVDDILNRMTLEEKVGQIIQPEITNIDPDEVRQYNIGSVLNGGNGRPNNDIHASVDDWTALADAYYLASIDKSDGGVGIPIIWGIDAVHGNNGIYGATIFPHNIGLGAGKNTDLMEQIGSITALETAIIGLDWTFAPTVAVARDDRWGRTYESYSEDPNTVAALAAAYVEGTQGKATNKDTFFSEGKVIATAKHFIGDGGTLNGRDQGNAETTLQVLRDVHAPGYFATLEAGAQTVMASYSQWNGVRMHGATDLLTGALKEQMGFDGFVIGDFNGHAMIPGCSNGNCPQALLAGVDMYMVPKDWKSLYNNLIEQVNDGTIPQARLDDAVSRILTVKMRAGLFDRPKPSQREFAGRKDLLGSVNHRNIARQAVRESLVLLKNNGNVLPIDPTRHILIAGPLADDISAQAGGWSLNWQGTGLTNHDFPGATTILDGFKEAVGKAGGSVEYAKRGEFKKRPDVAIVIFGETPYAEYQGDLETLKFKASGGAPLKTMKSLQAKGIPVVAVFLSGRPLWASNYINKSDAFVAAWLPGTEGNGVSDVLLGDKNGNPVFDFKGKLSFSWPRFANQYVLNTGDEVYTPLFELGYGLDYSDKVSLPRLKGGDGLTEIEKQLADPNGIFAEGRPIAPWRMYVGDSIDGRMKTEGERYAASVNGAVFLESVDRNRQEDSKNIRWSGKETASAFVLGYRQIDLSRAAAKGNSIVMEFKVISKPTLPVSYQLGCGGKCMSSLDLTDLFERAELDTWTTVSIPLSCFAKDTDFKKIDRPLHLETAGSFEMELYSVRIGDAEESSVECVSE